MPKPLLSDVHIDQALTEMSIGHMQPDENFGAGKIFPEVTVRKESDKFFLFDQADANRDDAEERVPGTEAAEIDWRVSTDNYSMKTFAAKVKVPDRLRDNSDLVDIENSAVRKVTQSLKIRRERFVKGLVCAGSVWTNEVAGNAAPGAGQVLLWSDPNSNPVKNIRDAIAAVDLATDGLPANKLLLGRDVWYALIDHPQILGRLGVNDPLLVTKEIVARLFDLKEIIVAGGVYTTSAKGAATATFARIWAGVAFLAYAPDAPALDEPSAGYCFRHAVYDGVPAEAAAIKRYREERLESDFFEGQIQRDFQVTHAGAGYLYTTLV